ncbi:MAG: NepR family anti-sigma factor [Amaricoccus sp.]|uniref:NepR family anti-sigma factor n=1 Tax=Amaricoccus sp. TaxID=1872485 RepID=UPI003315C6A0
MTDFSPPSTGRPRRSRSGADPLDPHGEIARRLRALYSADAQEPIPSDLIALLEQLDEAEGAGSVAADEQAAR